MELLKTDRKMIFEITGKDLKNLKEFQIKHEQCIYKHPNISCAQYEYSFIPDGFGVFKIVKCICGESISLTSDYDLGNDMPFHGIKKEPKDYNKDLLARLLDIEKRPGMFFGKTPDWCEFSCFLKGILSSNIIQAKYFDSIDLDLTNEIAEMLFEVRDEIENGSIAETDAIRSFYELLHSIYDINEVNHNENR